NQSAGLRVSAQHREGRLMNVVDLDAIDLDDAMFDASAFRLTDQENELAMLARRAGKARFAPRAEKYDREAIFPTENYQDMHRLGLLGICVPKENGGQGAHYRTYMLTAAEIGRYC